MTSPIWAKKLLIIALIFGGCFLFSLEADGATYNCTCSDGTTGTFDAIDQADANGKCNWACPSGSGTATLSESQTQTESESQTSNDYQSCIDGCSTQQCIADCQSDAYQSCVDGCLDQACINACAGDYGGGGGGAGGGGGIMPGAPVGNTQLPGWVTGDVGVLILNVVNFLINYIALPLAILMIILAGFRFATAQGNEEKLKKAKQNFMWTVIGVAVVLAAKIIVTYIQELLSGTSGGQLQAFITRIRGTLNVFIGMLFALVTVYFIWGVIQYVRSGGDEEMLKQGKRHMVWGIIGMAIMAAALGIVNTIALYVQ